MSAVLVIGYGNRDLSDDGVAYFVIEALRRRQRERGAAGPRSSPPAPHSGMTTMFVHQLLPEMAVALKTHDRLIFVDAHIDPSLSRINQRLLQPRGQFAAFSHHLPPEIFLALCGLYRRRPPVGYLVSILGHTFDSGRQLSSATAALVDEAAQKIICLVEGNLGLSAEVAHAWAKQTNLYGPWQKGCME